MSRSLRTPEQQALRRLLAEARVTAGLTQAQLASRLSRPQSFVAKYELGERRLDVIEFCAVARSLDQEPIALLSRFVEVAGT